VPCHVPAKVRAHGLSIRTNPRTRAQPSFLIV
jgi:hypothetical protein